MTERDLEDLLAVIGAMQQKIERLEAREINPVGTILMNTNPIIPANHLACDGTSYNKTQYETLYAVLGTRFGGDSTTFKVPDLRGRMPIGSGNDWGVGEFGGAEEHTLTINEIPSHDHPPALGTNYYHTGIARANPGAGAGSFDFGAATANTGLTGGGAAHNNMPPYLVISFIIVAR